MAKKITLKNKNGDVLCPHTAIEQVQGLKEALDNKLGKTEKAVSAKTTKVSKSSEADPNFALSFYAGQAEASTTPTADKVYVGSSVDGSVISVPALDGSTSMANYMNLRMSFNSKFFHEIAVSPNSNGIYHRNVRNGNALEWKQLLEGLVTTSKIADAAITPAKIQTSIALNGTPSMTVEPTTSSPDKTIASVGLVKEAVADLEIDTRNLLTNSKEITIDGSALTSGSKYITKKLPISVEVGDVLTFNCEDLIINAGTGQTHAIVLRVPGVGALAPMQWISPTSKTATITVTQASDTPHLYIYAGYADDSAGKSITYKGATLVKGTKPMLLWQPAPEDINTEISNAETRSKAHAEDYTNAEIDKIENGQTVAQKANSLYDDVSRTYKNWGEIDTAITRKIGDKFEDYATKSYVQGELSKQVSVPIASETEYGKVALAKPEDITAVEKDLSAVNDTAKAVTPYTLKEYIASKSFVTSSELSSQLGNINTILNSIINQ